MNKFIRLIQTYLMIGFPFVIGFMFWNTMHPQDEFLKNSLMLTRIIWTGFAFNLMFWFLVLIAFLIILVAIPNAREKTLTRLANLKERDEREEYITGKAARATYISTLSMMILFLFLSVFTVNISRTPQNQTTDNKHRLSLGIGVHFSLLDKSKIEKIQHENVIFDSTSISLSTPAIILILLGWQLLVFNLVARRIESSNKY